jgi:23S rRNA (cytosine1962-C5)-methyltransferase
MQLLTLKDFPDYELIDSGGGMRLERFGKTIISKPDPQAIWERKAPVDVWNKVFAIFRNGKWEVSKKIPNPWIVEFENTKLLAKLTPFKHVGIFPEQAVFWKMTADIIKNSGMQKLKVLNLFGYTGAASISCAKAGAFVTHVDASKPSISYAKENMLLSGLAENSIRWIIDDAIKFTTREIKRGNLYDGIILDPPVYGHGPQGEPWDFYKNINQLLLNCKKLLSPKPIFIIFNAYAISSSSIMLSHLLDDITKGLNGKIEYGELTIQESYSRRLLSTGIFGYWIK